MRKSLKSLLCMAIAFIAASCVITDRRLDETDPAVDPDIEVTLRLRTPGGFSPSAASTRALSYEDENRIETIHVMAFDSSTGVLSALRRGEVTSSETTPGEGPYSGTGSFTVTLPTGGQDQTFDLVVLANLGEGDLYQALTESLVAGTSTYAEVVEALVIAVAEPLYSDGGTVPMWGVSEAVDLRQGNPNLVVELTRAVARIDVGVGQYTHNEAPGGGDEWTWDGANSDGEPIPFRLTSVHVFQPGGAIAVMPDPETEADKPTVPEGSDPLDEPWEYAVENDLYSTREIYLPEADIRQGESAPGGDKHTSRMAIVIGGVYTGPGGGGTTYYRADFVKGGKLIDVLRNHLYQFNIASVSGPGYPDPERAYAGESINMTINVFDWNDGEMSDIEWVGRQYFAFGERPVRFEALGGTRNVTLRTNIAEGFTMTLTGGGTLTAPTAIGTPATYSAGGNAFAYSLTLNEITGEERRYTLAITATPNFGPASTTRTDGWTIAAGTRLTTPFEARQTSSLTDPTPYTVTIEQTDGGTALASPVSTTEGTTVTLLARPDANRRFVRWEFTAGGESIVPAPDPTANPLTFAMPAEAVALRAVWALSLSPLPPLPIAPTHNDGYILYFDGTGDDTRLLLSEWGDGHALNKDNYRTQMAFFKFGSVIGISHSGKENGSANPSFELSDIKFNPSTLTIGQGGPRDIGSYSNGIGTDMTVANTPPAIPGYLPEHFNATPSIADISKTTGDDAYHTFANLLDGRGDPCQLVGLTAGEIKAALVAGEGAFNALIASRDANAQYKGWRLPTNTDNQTFIGNTAGSTTSHAPDTDQYDWIANAAIATNPGTGLVKQPAVYLPAAGLRNKEGGYVHSQGTDGGYWSSTPSNSALGHRVYLYSSGLFPSSRDYYAFGTSIRCIRPDRGVDKSSLTFVENENYPGRGQHVTVTATGGWTATATGGFNVAARGDTSGTGTFSGTGTTDLLVWPAAANPGPNDITGTLTITFADYGTATVALTQQRPVGGADDILYFEGTGDKAVLRIGKWRNGATGAAGAPGTFSNTNMMVFFKFGGVVGSILDTLGDEWDTTDLKYNPTTFDVTSWGITNNAANMTLDASNYYVPGYLAANGSGLGLASGSGQAQIDNSKIVSSPEYHTVANLLVGKGDPCQLVGLTVEQIKEALAEGRVPENKEGWRSPTLVESHKFFGGTTTSNDTAYSIWTERTTGSTTDPGYRTFTGTGTGIGSYLPATGYRNRDGSEHGLGIYGNYWASTPISTTHGHRLGFSVELVNPSDRQEYQGGRAIRCVHPAPLPPVVMGVDKRSLTFVENENYPGRGQHVTVTARGEWTARTTGGFNVALRGASTGTSTLSGSGNAILLVWPATPNNNGNAAVSDETDRTGNLSITSAGTGSASVSLLQQRPIGGSDDILYIEESVDGPILRVGKWRNAATGGGGAPGTFDNTNVMAFFKFGGVVGSTFGADGNTWVTTDLKFNPTTFDVTIWSTPYERTFPNVPGYLATNGSGSGVSADSNSSQANNSKIVSSPEYHTVENLRVGKGDPCQLADLTVGEIQAALAAGRVPENKEGWRSPTDTENQKFYGSASIELPGTNSTWYSGTSSTTNPGYHWFLIGNGGYLPAAGYLTNSGGKHALGSSGMYWSSTPGTASNGNSLYFFSAILQSISAYDYQYGAPIRCVRDETPAPLLPGNPTGPWTDIDIDNDLN